jgi:imidazolonepropionase-like amidohydrolase
LIAILTSLFLSILSLKAEVYYVKPKAYLDVTSGQMVYGKIIGIKDETIKSISSTFPQGSKLINLPDTYLVPGFTDCHTHLLFTQEKKDHGFEGALQRELKLSDDFRIQRAKEFLKQYTKAGFTAVCDLGNSGNFLDYKLKTQIKDDPAYPAMYISGPGIASASGQFENLNSKALAKKEYTLIDKNTDIDKMLAPYLEKKVDILKVYLDNSPGPGNLTEMLLKKILFNKQSKKFKKITFHASSQFAYDMAVKYHLHNLEHLTGAVFKEAGLKKTIFITPTDIDMETLKAFDYYNKFFYDNQINRLKFIYKKNINIVFGADFYFNRTDALFNRAEHVKKTIKVFQLAGIKNIDILRFLTINPARTLGDDKKWGEISVRHLANLIGFSKNPLEDLSIIQENPIVINRGHFLK